MGSCLRFFKQGAILHENNTNFTERSSSVFFECNPCYSIEKLKSNRILIAVRLFSFAFSSFSTTLRILRDFIIAASKCEFEKIWSTTFSISFLSFNFKSSESPSL
ncbi:dubious, TSS is downstream of MET, relates to 5'UTR of adjacent gene [Schizosaccharomyces pombe]|uniref:Uncharacterized protein P27G11.16 n=1 Tax=Schizosaccharomyces pombe (strain 972 / ATCC 24843) TaxID=284812 RepID=YIOG_SCHPO|nr:uncharacterized protein SPAP27G11.16 [Schizosaccharomyces pombe]Q9C109.1 RecName: Full=Uncharacterized protein P27G11.16 [Schizosaccharomyces pombe 972h-]CAC34992.1 sequence orphan [Schizosaccharomyces pombe]|eukprot:NP_593416.1 uncharacterized protein SPAP27G11.16 [Schizosaccharomyces pombe]